jgi:hypothetical protein
MGSAHRAGSGVLRGFSEFPKKVLPNLGYYLAVGLLLWSLLGTKLPINANLSIGIGLSAITFFLTAISRHPISCFRAGVSEPRPRRQLTLGPDSIATFIWFYPRIPVLSSSK